LVVNVYYQCDQERKVANYIETKDAHTRTANYTGIGRRQVVEIVGHYNKTGVVPISTMAGNRSVHQTNIPALVEEHIRELIFSKHLNGEVCTANHVKNLLDRILKRDVPHRTICDHLHRMGFNYSRTHKKTRSLRESQHIRQQRHTYIHDIRKFRNSGYKPVYLDESFLHHYHGHQFSWFNNDVGDYLERLGGRGRRWCFINAMTESGLVPNASLIFEAKKSSGDYHDMFNAKHFQEWWKEKLLPNIPAKCVIIVDRAPYHCVPEEQIIARSMRKEELQNWLTSKKISWKTEWLKPKLIETVEDSIDDTPIIQKIAENMGHKFLLLPVHHPELNPIELVWGIVKNECGRLLRNGIKFLEVREHLVNAFDKITSVTCSKLHEKIREKEDEYWVADIRMDDID
jgi:transposase